MKIELTDNGIGILEENIKKIFNHGFTTKKTGHGYGLHSSAIVAEEMNGKIEVISQGIGKGATFIFQVPVEKKIDIF